MASLRHNNSLVNLLDKKLHKLSKSKMRISKSAPDLLKKAVTSVKSKTDALRTKLIIVASLHRRLAMACAMSRQIHGLVTLVTDHEKQARVVEHRSKALTTHKAMETTNEPAGGRGLFEVAVFEEGYHGYPDWINSLFDDDKCYNDDDEDAHEDDSDDLRILDASNNEQSVIEIIRNNREVEGLEFNMEDDIDEACDMFIRRVRSRIMKQTF